MLRQARPTIALLALAAALLTLSAWAATDCKVVLPLDGRNARLSESSLGDLVADAARVSLRADLALMQASQLRADVIPQGELTEQCVAAALFYPDEQVVLVEMPGAKVLAALERGLSALPQPSTAFLQVSGITVSFRSTGRPEQRVDSVKVGNEPLDTKRTYRVALPASLAKGAVGYFRVFDGLQPKQTGPSLSAAVLSYARAVRVLSITPGQRLRDLTPPAPRGSA